MYIIYTLKTCTHAHQYKSDKTKQINGLENNAMYLFDYCNQLATLIANYEKVPLRCTSRFKNNCFAEL